MIDDGCSRNLAGSSYGSVCRISLFIAATALASCGQSQSVATREEILQITPHDIWIVFRENRIAAEAMYAGKNLRVTATVGGIELEDSARPVVLLVTPEDEFPVRAELVPTAAEKATALKEGDRKIFSCTGLTEFAQAPMLLNCSL